MTEKIMVTGGLGFIGSHLVTELRNRGHEVWTCDIRHSEDPQHVKCDVCRDRQMERALSVAHFDYVYNLAAEYGRWNGEDFYENLWNTNVVGTKNILQIQRKQKFRLVQFSSAEVYGDYDGVMSEAVMEKVPIRQMNDYAMTKWVNEMQVMNAADMWGSESVRVRPVNAYGPGEYYSPYRGALIVFCYKALHDQPYTVYKNHRRSYDYVEDTCRTFANIVDRVHPGEVYNVGSDEEITIKQLSDMILEYLGKGDSKVTYKESEPFTTRVKKMDFSKAVRDLKHDPRTPLREGLAKTIEWMRKVYGN